MSAAERVRRNLTRLGTGGAAAVLLCLVLAVLFAQGAGVGVFSRIYMGDSGANNPQIRWGSSDPTGACVPGSIYLQKVSGQDRGNFWRCVASGQWQTSGGGSNGEYLVTDFGAKCDGSTDDGAVLNAVSALIAASSSKTGTIVLPAATCYYTGGWRLGPSTIPWGIEPGSSPGLTDVAISLTAPRSATFTYSTPDASGNVTLTFTGSTLTSGDVGNEVFYGTTDAAYQAYDARVIAPTPTYACQIATVNAGAHTATCTKLATHGTILTTDVPLAATSGSHASWVTNDHDFIVTDANNLTADHVSKTFQFTVPVIRAPLDLVGLARNDAASVDPGTAPCTKANATGNKVGVNQGAWSSGTTYANTARVQSGGHQWVSLQNANLNHAPPTYPTLSNAWWHYQDSFLCLNGGNVKLKYFQAEITSVTDSKHGKMLITGLASGSNAEGNFPDSAHTNETNSGTYGNHEWCHGLAAAVCMRASNTHLDHSIDYDVFDTEYRDSEGTTPFTLSEQSVILPYFVPLDTNTVHISVRGAGAYSTLLKWGGIGSEPANTPAMVISRDKQFRLDAFTLFNAETCGSGSCYDTHSRVGLYFGGMPGSGTQTFFMVGTQLEVNGFNQCVLMGDNLGGETSDESFDQLSMTYCNQGLVMAPGSFNTLDVKVHNIGGGFNKVAVVNGDGNLIIQNGTMSYNGIDFFSAGFGPFTIAGMRSEGPGRFAYGTEPAFSIRDSNVVEPQGARTTTGTVTCTPLDVADVTVDVGADTGGPPTNTFFPLTFSASALVGEDVGKTLVIELSGGNLVGYVNSISSSTTGEFVRQYGTAAVESGKSAHLYSSDRCAMTWDANQALSNDVGAAFMLPNADTHADYGSLAKVYIDQVTSTTTGVGHWVIAQGGPVVHGGSSDVDPVLFDNIAVEIKGGGYNTLIDNLASYNIIAVQAGSSLNGSLQLTNSSVLAAPLMDSRALPVRLEQPGKAWHITTTPTGIPAPQSNSGHTSGTQFPGVVEDSTNNFADGTYHVRAFNNYGRVYAGPSWPLPDVDGFFIRGVMHWFTNRPASQKDEAGHNEADNHPYDPVRPVQQVASVISLGEFSAVAGKNLRLACTFSSSDIVSCGFKRDETLTYTYAAGVNYNAALREAKFAVSSGHFSTADLGKTICYDNSETDTGTRNVCGYVSVIVDATHIKIRQAVGALSLVQGTSNFSLTGHVGEDEPDANYRVFLSCNAQESFAWSNVTTSGFDITSSNATSTATCNALIIR